MPVAAAVAPLAGAAIGAISGATNKRPPSLTPQQSTALNADLSAAQQTATGPVQIDPNQQKELFANNAQQLTGANAQVSHALASRGIAGNSGVTAAALENNSAQSSANQNNINLSLSQQALQNQQYNRGLIANLTNVKSTPGQSSFGAATAGAAGPLAYGLQQAYLKSQGQSGSSSPSGSPSFFDSTGTSQNDLQEDS